MSPSLSPEQPDEHVLRRALARTARSEESENLALPNRKRDVMNRRSIGAGVRVAEGVNLDHGASAG